VCRRPSSVVVVVVVGSVPIEFPRMCISVNPRNCTYAFPRMCINLLRLHSIVLYTCIVVVRPSVPSEFPRKYIITSQHFNLYLTSVFY